MRERGIVGYPKDSPQDWKGTLRDIATHARYIHFGDLDTWRLVEGSEHRERLTDVERSFEGGIATFDWKKENCVRVIEHTPSCFRLAASGCGMTGWTGFGEKAVDSERLEKPNELGGALENPRRDEDRGKTY